MEIIIDVLLFDKNNNLIEETSFEKPETYQKLLERLKDKLKNLPNYFNISIQPIDGSEIIINDEQNYKLINDIIFIREIKEDDFRKSVFQLNYDRLSESKQDILDEKFNCSICYKKIKNEKPLFCYKCQKIFHNNCLNDWDKKMKLQNKNLSCPNCRSELPLDKWEHKLDFEDNRKSEAEKMNKFSQYDLILKTNKAQEKKINELYLEIEKQKKNLEESFKFIKEILFKVEEIIDIINPNNNNNINDLMKILSVKNENFPYKNISQITLKKLEMIKKNIHTIFRNQQPQQGQNQQFKQGQFFVQQGQNQPQSFQNLTRYQQQGAQSQEQGGQYQQQGAQYQEQGAQYQPYGGQNQQQGGQNQEQGAQYQEQGGQYQPYGGQNQQQGGQNQQQGGPNPPVPIPPPEIYIFPLTGLVNIGSTCYMNATLQCLLHISELIVYFIKEFPNDQTTLNRINKSIPSSGDISRVFYNLVIGVYDNPINTTNSRKKLKPQTNVNKKKSSNIFNGFSANLFSKDNNDILEKLLLL